MKGSTHFRHQRLSAYALTLLLPALMAPFPFSIILQGLVFIIALYHGLLGMVMVIEDYVQSRREMLILAAHFVTMILMGVVVWYVGSQLL